MIYYQVTYSDIKDKPVNHLPITAKTKFRSFERACTFAKRLHKQNRDIVIVENDNDGFIANWELLACGMVIFNDEEILYKQS